MPEKVVYTDRLDEMMRFIHDEFIKAVKFYFSPIIALSKDFSIQSLKRDYRDSPTILGLSPLSDDNNQKPNV